jgi:hypothetical protein
MKRGGPLGRRHDPREVRELLSAFDLHLASPQACDAAHALAVEMISPRVALATTLRRAQETTRAAIFVTPDQDAPIGVLAILPLNSAGTAAVQQHLFDPRNPPSEYLSAAGDAFAGLYGWGFCATTRKASADVLTASRRLREHFADVPFFTRAATPAGARVLRGRLRYSPYPGAPDDLLWNPVRNSQERAA